ncbi:alpha/beta hydrolase [Streptomyces sp. RB6PN25]|uniref:Alpha/beta hydrolase n=1 Tax=Streptomyces humicola TaxID=2953240 RepID=A0ABT1Q440_9ACTN|nr:alpha/beta hydrolase [Streptomyces humicola]MCQ4084688.1 alpha/beta hydrolase [Streptomyces humicola]
MILRIDGIPLHVVREGSGPVCVLSAGLGMCWFDWDPVVPLLTPYRTVVRFDRPGLRLSAPATTPPTLLAEAHRIRSVLDALALTGPCTVVGHSLAAFHAEAFARLHPGRTTGVVLVDGSDAIRRKPPPAPCLRIAAAQALADVLTASAVPYLLGPAARRLVWRASSLSARDPAPPALVRRCYRTGRGLRAALQENVRHGDVAAELCALRSRAPLPPVPVTVLAAYDASGSARSRRSLERQRALADTLGAAFRVAAPAGHMVMTDSPGDLASAILATVPAASR